MNEMISSPQTVAPLEEWTKTELIAEIERLREQLSVPLGFASDEVWG